MPRTPEQRWLPTGRPGTKHLGPRRDAPPAAPSTGAPGGDPRPATRPLPTPGSSYTPWTPRPPTGGTSAPGRGATVPNAGSYNVPPATTPRDFYAEASLLYPWLPVELLAIFAEAWERYAGDTALALATMRQSDAYLRYYPGNRRTDGSIRLNEQDYLATLDAYAANLANRQLNPDLFSHRFVELIEGEVSADEFDARLGLVYNQIVGRFDEMREWLAGDFGIEATDEAIYAFALNPEELGDDILNRRITNAQIGGWARFYGARQGQQMDRDRIDYLRQMGVNETQARQVYSTVGERLPQLDTFASRYDSRDRTFDLDEYESLAFLDDPNQGSRARRLIEQERSLFTGGRVARGRTGEVTGLEQR